MAIRRKRIDSAFRDRALQQLALLPITVDTETGMHAWSSTLSLADQFDLTIYDAAYLELARRRSGLPIASLDAKLGDAGEALGIPVLGRTT